MAYPNGQVPLTVLYPVAWGTNRDGYWEHRMAPGQKARWEALVSDVLANEGVRLKITDGWNAYRPLDAQWTAYRNSPPGMAAYPGTSSHGGIYKGRDAMAIDVANWGELGQAKFYSYARKHGFTAGAISNEPWHIIDYDPWTAPPAPEPPLIGDDAQMIRIQHADRGIALIGPGYYRPLAGPDLAVSSAIMTRHITFDTAAEFDRAVSLALAGQYAGQRDSRPMKVYRWRKALWAIHVDRQVAYQIPNDAYATLLDALGMTTAVIREINDAEQGFMQQIGIWPAPPK